jgi:hypothetical protein
MRRRILIALGEMGCAAAEANQEMYSGLTAAEALGKWCYHNRESLGLRIELLRPGGELVPAPTE